MTNAEKYLKEGANVEELIKQLYEIQDFNYNTNMRNCKKFFEEEIKPTLTEDERVILRNIDFDFIGRNPSGIYVRVKKDGLFIPIEFYLFKPHLFQFIKERRRI